MARTYLTFVDIEGKLNVLRAECTKWAATARRSLSRGTYAREI